MGNLLRMALEAGNKSYHNADMTLLAIEELVWVHDDIIARLEAGATNSAKVALEQFKSIQDELSPLRNKLAMEMEITGGIVALVVAVAVAVAAVLYKVYKFFFGKKDSVQASAGELAITMHDNERAIVDASNSIADTGNHQLDTEVERVKKEIVREFAEREKTNIKFHIIEDTLSHKRFVTLQITLDKKLMQMLEHYEEIRVYANRGIAILNTADISNPEAVKLIMNEKHGLQTAMVKYNYEFDRSDLAKDLAAMETLKASFANTEIRPDFFNRVLGKTSGRFISEIIRSGVVNMKDVEKRLKDADGSIKTFQETIEELSKIQDNDEMAELVKNSPQAKEFFTVLKESTMTAKALSRHMIEFCKNEQLLFTATKDAVHKLSEIQIHTIDKAVKAAEGENKNIFMQAKQSLAKLISAL